MVPPPRRGRFDRLLFNGPPVAKSDAALKLEVEGELDADEAVDAAQILVTVDGGVVTLLGRADSHAARWAAEKAARRVSGVRSVAQNLTVSVPDASSALR